MNPAVTQKTIGETICVPGWARRAAPVGYTEEVKHQQIAALGYHDRRLSLHHRPWPSGRRRACFGGELTGAGGAAL
jgi:hypothetical protein